jgi:virulence-associated protein VagC
MYPNHWANTILNKSSPTKQLKYASSPFTKTFFANNSNALLQPTSWLHKSRRSNGLIQRGNSLVIDPVNHPISRSEKRILWGFMQRQLYLECHIPLCEPIGPRYAVAISPGRPIPDPRPLSTIYQ